MPTRRVVTLLLTGCLAASLLPATARADDSVPAELALKVMLKVLTYDGAFATHGGGDFVIAVAYPEGEDGARDTAMNAAGQLSEKTIQGRTIRFVPLSFTTAASLLEQAKKAEVNAFIAPGGLRRSEYAAIAQTATTLKAYGLSLVPEGAEAGLVLGVANNNGRPQVLLNREASQAIGANWPPAVLKLAKLL